MSVLILIDPHQPAWAGVAARLVSAAGALGAERVVALVAGSGASLQAERLAWFTGVSEVIWCDHLGVARVPPEDLAEHVAAVSNDFDHIIAAASTFGAECIPRIAARLGVSPVTGVVSIRDPVTLVRPAHAGGVRMVVRVAARPVLLTVQPWAFAAAAVGSVAAVVRQGADLVGLGLSHSCGFIPATRSGQEDLSMARVVVAGGGGLERSGSFAPVEALAHALGGTVGASRGAVDAGLAPADLQIGQTGRIIAPGLYVALGISGAVQHLAGIKEAGCVVSINTDPQAPMAAVADFALTGDLHAVVPEWIGEMAVVSSASLASGDAPGGSG
ncbi:MAG: electron transfer flavoprotein subunit alpha/FixB family protein [Magnetococcales bacterium]|nr:electron transfer flavoprotein subunit alpha/FixB family protein [Magnetococcales bacterium]